MEMCNANVLSIVACIGDINRWMTSNRLKLNTDKTDFILLGTRQQLEKISLKEIDISGVRVPVSTTVTCLGVLIQWAHVRRTHQTSYRPVFLQAPSTSVHPSHSHNWSCKNTCPCISNHPRGLLQQHIWFDECRTSASTPVCCQRSRPSDCKKTEIRPHYTLTSRWPAMATYPLQMLL